MDLCDTPHEAEIRARARAFLNANARPRRGDSRPPGPPADVAAHVAAAKEWQARKAAAGFAGIRWPREWGGQGGSAIEEVIWQQEEQTFDVPRGVFDIGLGMCIPTLMAYATTDQLKRHTGPTLRGEEIWCQMFSEPDAGSDLAGLRTRAVRDGDDWVIDGQKIWTSGAHYSDFGILLTRTDPTQPKHKGLTMFFVDMKSPGIEVRPIHQMSGGAHFNEVFFTGLRVPDSQRLGQPGDGWKVALTTLMNERLAVGDESRPDINDLIAFARSWQRADGSRPIDDAAARHRIADWYARSQGVRNTRFRAITALSRGQTPGPEASIGRLVNAIKQQEMARFAVEQMGAAGMLTGPDGILGGVFQQSLLTSPAGRIAGGTSEILRNIIAERVLGLPADIRVDKDMAFQDIRQGSERRG